MRDKHYWKVADNVFGTAWKRGKQASYSCSIASLQRGKIAYKYNAFSSIEAAQKWALDKYEATIAKSSA